MTTLQLPQIYGQTGDLGTSQGVTAFATNQTNVANDYIVKLGNITFAPPTIHPVFPLPPSAPALSVPTPPAVTQILWTAPAIPAPFTGTLDVQDFMPAAFDTLPPVMSFPAAPTAFSDSIPDAPGVDLAFEMPTLTVSLPSPPALLSLNISKFDGLNLPAALDSNVPVLEAVAPSVREYVPGAAYTSSLLQAMQASLQDRIENGGTGIKPEVEQAIWDRAREREFRSQADALAELERMEELGYALPPGVFLDARVKIQTETNYTTAGLSRDIAIKQAELEQENVKLALANATQLEGSLMTYRNQVEQRLFDSCRYATEAGISLYNAKVQAYTAFVDAYKTKVAIYEAQIRGELARVDVYKTQIQAEQAKADINKSLVEEYRVLTEVALSNVEIFKAEISAIQARATIESLKVQIYGEQVRGYSAKVNAFTAGVEGFRAQISAEATKQDAYKSQVQAYTARVEAGAKAAEVRIEEFKGRISAKNAEYDGYKAIVGAESARVQALATNNTSVAEVYKATVQGLASYNEVLTKQWQVSIDQAQRVTEIGIAAAKANAELYMTTRSLASDAAKVGAQVNAQLGAAAMGVLHWSQSYSYSQSTGFSTSESRSTSDAKSTSKNENYNYSV